MAADICLLNHLKPKPFVFFPPLYTHVVRESSRCCRKDAGKGDHERIPVSLLHYQKKKKKNIRPRLAKKKKNKKFADEEGAD